MYFDKGNWEEVPIEEQVKFQDYLDGASREMIDFIVKKAPEMGFPLLWDCPGFYDVPGVPFDANIEFAEDMAMDKE